MGNEAPLITTLSERGEGVATAATDSFAVGKAPYAGTVTGITYTPDAAATGDNTNARTFTVVNKGQSGVGTTVVGTLALITGVNLVAFDEKAFTLSGVAGATTVAADDQLAFVSTATGTGVADPGGQVEITISRTGAGS